jgi:DNA-binding Xre family transcriptional regulator
MSQNGEMTVKWKVKEFLDSNSKTPYALWKASGLSRNQTYAICNGEQDGLRFDGLSKLILGLEKLTGQLVTPNDVLEVVR